MLDDELILSLDKSYKEFWGRLAQEVPSWTSGVKVKLAI